MLLQTLPFFGNSWCKHCELILRFMKSVFHHKPQKPRYLDVSIVLKYLSSLMPLNKLTLKMLTLKTVALVSLSTAPRAQTLVHMSIKNLIKEKDALIFLFKDILKTSRQGRSFSLKIQHYGNESLCAMHTLLAYLCATEARRLSDFVFVSYITYKNVSSCTIARWLKLVLELSGINTGIFKAHSYMSAATTAAFTNGCSLKTILDTADWEFRQELSEVLL